MGKKSKKNQQKKHVESSQNDTSDSAKESELNVNPPEELETEKVLHDTPSEQSQENSNNVDADGDVNEDELEDEPIVEREPSRNSSHSNVAEAQHHEEASVQQQQEQHREAPQQEGIFNSSWTSWISDSTSRAMKSMQSSSNQLGKSIQSFVKEEVIGEEKTSKRKTNTEQTAQDQQQQQQEAPTESQWFKQAGSLVSSWWSSAKSAQEVQFVKTMASDMGKDIIDLGRTLLEETEELLSQSGAQGRSRGKTGLLSHNDQTPWQIYYQQYINDESFPEKSVDEWFAEMGGAQKLQILVALSGESREKLVDELAEKLQSEENLEKCKRVDALIEEASTTLMTSAVDDESNVQSADQMRETPSGRELQRVFTKAHNFSSKFVPLQKEFHEHALQNIESRTTEFVELLHVTLQMQQHLQLEGNRILAQIATKAITHVYSFADELAKKQQFTVPYEFKVKDATEEGSFENVFQRIRGYTVLVLRELKEIGRAFAGTSHPLSEFVRNAREELNKDEHDESTLAEIQEMVEDYDAATRRIPSAFVIESNKARELFLEALSPSFGEVLKFVVAAESASNEE